MFTAYNYHTSSAEFNDIIDGAVALVKDTYEGVRTENRAQKLVDLNKQIIEYSLMGTRYEGQGSEAFKNPQVTRNGQVRDNFDAVIAEIITAAAPAVASAEYAEYFAEVHQVGWGETARFIIHSNDLFKVNEIAEGVTRGALQPIYDDEITVNTGKVEVATSIDFYQVAAGVFDWGVLGAKLSKSFAAYVFLKIVAAMTSAASQLGAGYTASGFSTANWIKLEDLVSAANGGNVAVYGIGTLAALNKVIPETVGLQYGLGEKMADQGHLDKYLGARLIPIDQVLVPGTVNSTNPKFAVPADKIYFVAADKDKPAKVVYEGDQVVVERDEKNSTDRKYTISIQMRIGTAAIVGSKFGILTLN